LSDLMGEVEDVDLLVIGGGKAGKSLAMDRAKAGWKVVMAERDKIGGTCINVACIPTKALVGSARTMLTARRAAQMGIEIGGEPRVSLERLRRHKESVVGGMVSTHEKLFADSGMDFILGTARFVDERTAEIASRDGTRRVVRGRDVVINTGTTPALPALEGIGEVEVWNSETILTLHRLPESLLVLGGGYVGCEFASMFAIFGTRVTLIQGPPQVLPREDPDVAAAPLLRAGLSPASDSPYRAYARRRAHEGPPSYVSGRDRARIVEEAFLKMLVTLLFYNQSVLALQTYQERRT
jgi:pyruvate/2-oxoglutarate dehydrogenase complex dihydrolipoamide dehydrogenase (E3) component